MPLAASQGIGARLASGLRAAINVGGCRHLWSLSVTLDDYESDCSRTGSSRQQGAARAETARRVKGEKATKDLHSSPVHPMNSFALAHAFHRRAGGGELGATLEGADNSGGGQRGNVGRPRGAIRSLGLPFAKLHARTVVEIAAHALPSLTQLDLSFCYIGAAGAAALALALHDPEKDAVGRREGGYRGRGSDSLRSLQLRHNTVGDSGAKALGRALARNRCLTYLSLASNCIGPSGGKALASGLGSEGTRLARLDVSDNPLDEASVRLLVGATGGAGEVKFFAGAESGGTLSDVDVTSTPRRSLQIIGLDRVTGTSVKTREDAHRAATETSANLRDDEESIVVAGLEEEVSVRLEDSIGKRDGFVEVGKYIFRNHSLGILFSSHFLFSFPPRFPPSPNVFSFSPFLLFILK